MTGKAKGGRGKKARNPYERFTVTLPPDLKVWLDDRAARQNLTRSEALALVLDEVRRAIPPSVAAPAVLPGTPELEEVKLEPRPVPRAEQVTGSKLTLGQARVCSSLQMRGAVAEYDFQERQWLAGFAGVKVNGDDLEELTRLGVLSKTGEGNAAIYRLIEN